MASGRLVLYSTDNQGVGGCVVQLNLKLCRVVENHVCAAPLNPSVSYCFSDGLAFQHDVAAVIKHAHRYRSAVVDVSRQAQGVPVKDRGGDDRAGRLRAVAGKSVRS